VRRFFPGKRSADGAPQTPGREHLQETADSNGEEGLALVSVLWALSILSLIAASMMSMGTLSVAMERNALRRAQADATTDAALALGILGLLDPRPERRWRVDGVAQNATFDGMPLRIAIQDEFGLIDLNTAAADVFVALFRSGGASDIEAQRLAERVIDWRTSGTARVLEGAAPADYKAAGLEHAPRRGPFQSVDELALVRGMTPQLFARVAPALTVYSQQPMADRRTAPREVLLALTGDARQANQAVAERVSAPFGVSGDGLPMGAGTIDPSIALNGRVFTITATFPYRETMVRKEMTVRLTGNGASPYTVFSAQ
jgi:general secretion pathway protein K